MDDLEAVEGTRLTAKGRATRDRIVSVAAELMFERGVGGTSMEDVRRAAAVGGSQLQHYFSDKRTLVRAVVAFQIDQLIRFHTQPKLGAIDSFDALLMWAELNVEAQVRLGMRGGCSFGSLAAELAESDEETRADLGIGYARWIELMREGLAAMRDRRELGRDADPDTLAAMLIASHQGGALMTEVQRDIEPLRLALQGSLDHVHSFAPKGTPRPVLRKRRRRPALRRKPAGSSDALVASVGKAALS